MNFQNKSNSSTHPWAWSTQIEYDTPIHVFNKFVLILCAWAICSLYVASNLKFLGRQAGHSRSVPIVSASFVAIQITLSAKQWLQPGIELGDHEWADAIQYNYVYTHEPDGVTNISSVTSDL